MPMAAVVSTYNLDNRVIPLYPGGKRIHVNIPPGATIVKGTVLGQITSSANALQTISDTPTITAGTFTISGTNPLTGETFTTAAIAYDATAAAVATAVQTALGSGGTVTGGGGALPGTDVTLTFSGAYAGRPVALMTISSAGLTGGTLAIANTTVGRSAGTFAAYSDGASAGTGTDTARGIMEYTMTARADGRVYIGTATDQEGEGRDSCPMYYTGTFRTTDLTGLTAAAVADLGRLISGTFGDGILVLSGS